MRTVQQAVKEEALCQHSVTGEKLIEVMQDGLETYSDGFQRSLSLQRFLKPENFSMTPENFTKPLWAMTTSLTASTVHMLISNV